MTAEQWERYVNNALPLAGAAASLTLSYTDLPLSGGNQINGNYLHCAISIDPVLKLHDLYGKHNAKGIYNNKIIPPVRSSIHLYQVRKKGGSRHDSIWKQGDTW